MRRILALARAEVLHIVRDRATLAQVLLLPIVQLLVLSNAATFEIRGSPIWVVDLDRSSASRGAIGRLAASGHFRIAGDAPSLDRANDAMLDGRATLAIVFPHGFEADLMRSGAATVQVSVNAEKGSAAGVVQSYAASILAAYARELEGAAAAAPRIEIREQSRYNPTMSYQHYMVPGILVALVTLVGTLLASQNIAREKELGTLDQLNVTPITRGQFIIGKLLPLWVAGMLELALGLTAALLVFGVPLRGSLLLLFSVAAVYLLVSLGIGLFVSTIVETQQQAMFVTFFINSAYLLMSGLMTPIDSMAPWARALAVFNPISHFVAISRAILLKGAELPDIARPFAILGVYAAVVLTIAVRQYRKQTA